MTDDSRTDGTGNSLYEQLARSLDPSTSVVQQARIVQAAIALVEGFPEKGVRRQEWIELVEAVDAYTGRPSRGGDRSLTDA